jgi:flagellar M-ring protein FliF
MSDTQTRDRTPRQAVDGARDRATAVLDGFTTGQKTTTVLAVVALLVAGMFFMRWVSQPSMVPLFSNLSMADAAAITTELDTQGTSYQLADGGRTIMVDRTEQAPLRLAMSGAGLMPSDGDGFALLDNHGVTTSEFIQNVDYQRAVAGELSSTISSMDIVDSARVHLVMPSDDLFMQDAKMATASVLLTLRGQAQPTPMQIQAIVNLVAGSVEGLDPAQVTITDTAGNVLAAPGADGQMAAMGDARQYQTTSFETKLASSVQAMLQRVVGPDAAVVTVTADLNFDTMAETTERFGNDGPGEGIPLETTITNENYTGIGPEQAGVLGPEGQIIGAGNGEETTYTLEDGSTRFAVDRTVSEILAAPGAVNRLSVAVLLDANSPAAADPQAVQALVQAAVGFDGARGDLIEVGALPFDDAAALAAEEAAEAAAAAAAQERMFYLIRTVGSVAIVMLVLFLAWRSARKSMPVREPRIVPIDIAELDVAEDDDDLIDYEVPELRAGPSLTDEVSELIDSQGDDVAGLLRGWMAER